MRIQLTIKTIKGEVEKKRISASTYGELVRKSEKELLNDDYVELSFSAYGRLYVLQKSEEL